MIPPHLAIARELENVGGQQRHRFGIVQLQAACAPSPSHIRGDEDQQTFLFARRQMHLINLPGRNRVFTGDKTPRNTPEFGECGGNTAMAHREPPDQHAVRAQSARAPHGAARLGPSDRASFSLSSNSATKPRRRGPHRTSQGACIRPSVRSRQAPAPQAPVKIARAPRPARGIDVALDPQSLEREPLAARLPARASVSHQHASRRARA